MNKVQTAASAAGGVRQFDTFLSKPWTEFPDLNQAEARALQPVRLYSFVLFDSKGDNGESIDAGQLW